MPQIANRLAPNPSNALASQVGAYIGYPMLAAQVARTRMAKAPDDEALFQNWIRGTDWFKEFKNQYNEEPDLNTKDYDYRAAWKAGIMPERDPYDQSRFHWPSSLPDGQMLKSANHPTAWKEYFMRDTGINPDALNLKSAEDAANFLKNKK